MLDNLFACRLARLVCDEDRAKGRRGLDDPWRQPSVEVLVDSLHVEVQHQVEVHFAVLGENVAVARHAIDHVGLADSRLATHHQ